jgi:stage II sporulation protein D
VTLRAVGGGRLTVGDRVYRGALRVTKVAGKLQLVNLVGLENYLLGVVPGEMPKDWPLDALKAQAVAARTYAIANLVASRPFDLYSDARSQLYYGAQAEAPGPTRAVTETRGQVLSYDGAPAQTFYFSSSGGRTLSALDAFGLDLPYLVSVADPWDELSPNHQWDTEVLNGATLGRRLGLRSAVANVAYEPGTPGAPAALRLTTSAGTVVDRRLADVRSQLGLKSLEFQLGVLRLDDPAADGARPPGVVRLTGLARDVSDVRLERRTAAGDWVSVARIASTPDGTFAVRVRATTTTAYRLTAGGVAGPGLTLRIAA